MSFFAIWYQYLANGRRNLQFTWFEEPQKPEILTYRPEKGILRYRMKAFGPESSCNSVNLLKGLWSDLVTLHRYPPLLLVA